MPIRSSRYTDRYIDIFPLSNIGNSCEEEDDDDLPVENNSKENESHGDVNANQSSEKEAIES